VPICRRFSAGEACSRGRQGNREGTRFVRKSHGAEILESSTSSSATPDGGWKSVLTTSQLLVPNELLLPDSPLRTPART
jgi:hypothetical protein